MNEINEKKDGSSAPSIFVVTDGCYSSYSIQAIFPTKEKADEYAYLQGIEGSCNIEEWDIDQGVEVTDDNREYVEAVKRFRGDGRTRFIVEMKRDGDTVRVRPYTEYDYGKTASECEATLGTWRGKKDFRCWAKDEKHAVKIANEKRVQLIAMGEWPEEPEPEIVVTSDQWVSFSPAFATSAPIPVIITVVPEWVSNFINAEEKSENKDDQ